MSRITRCISVRARPYATIHGFHAAGRDRHPSRLSHSPCESCLSKKNGDIRGPGLELLVENLLLKLSSMVCLIVSKTRAACLCESERCSSRRGRTSLGSKSSMLVGTPEEDRKLSRLPLSSFAYFFSCGDPDLILQLWMRDSSQDMTNDAACEDDSVVAPLSRKQL